MEKRNIRTLRRKQERKKFKSAIFLFLLVIFVSAVIYFFAKNFIIAKETITIGNHHLKKDEIKSLTGIRNNDRLFGVRSSEIYKRLKTSPWIKDAVIRKEMTGINTGRFFINVLEAVPLAIFSRDDAYYLIDNSGNMLEQLKEGTVLFLPVIKGMDPDKDRDAYMEAVKFAGILRDKKVLFNGGNVEITGRRPEDITLIIDNVHIIIGSGDFDRKLDKLQIVRDEIAKRNISVEYFDLRFEDKIIVKPSVPANDKSGDKTHKSKSKKRQG
ncbi:MAG: FtsQ-type POTRA domain-containing protein [Thermodesulfovibrionales bacterium]|nr:FtsQ-type POTRA domain-containing protein [Thermodesulfovibrionales bacterium]